MMVDLRLRFRDKQVGRKYRLRMEQHSKRFRRALLLAAQDAADEMVKLGRDDIARAGRFGRRWTDGLHADVGLRRGNVEIDLIHDVPYFPVFQEGRVIHGKPLLWIPLSFAQDAQKVRARDYPGPLFRVNRTSGKAPLLMTGSGGKAEAKYFGKESVTIPKKFHVLEIAREVASRIRAFFRIRLGE